MEENLVRMAKDGTTLHVHPTCVADHQRQGWVVAPPQAPEAPESGDDNSASEELRAARADYEAVLGKKPGPRWDVVQIRERIAAAKAGQQQ